MAETGRPLFRLLEEHLVDQIIDEALSVLERLGVFVEHIEATSLLLEHGARKDPASGHVLIPRILVERSLQSAPPHFRIFDSAGTRSYRVGGNDVHFDPGSAALKIHDSALNEERLARTRDLVRFHRLSEKLDHFHFQSTGLVSSDVPGAIQDAYRIYIALLYCTKPVVTGLFVTGGFPPMLDMLVAVRGTADLLRQKPLAIFDACPSAPLRWSNLTTHSVVECARAGIPSEFIAVPLAGATGPVTLSGSLVQHAAENLAGIVIAQIVSPGSPVVFGGSPAIFDMRSGNTPLGAVETMMLNAGHAQIGKRLGLPTHAYMGLSDAKSPDAQGGLESAIGTVLAGLTGINVVSGAGMLDFESCQSLEKMVIDHDVCGMVYRLIEGIVPRNAPMALDLLREVGHQSDFLGLSHTLDWYRREQHFPSLLDRGNYDQWVESGKPSLTHRASARVIELIAGEPRPVVPEPTRQELRRIMVGHAKSSGLDLLPDLEGN
jgi:trimethylamine:corrinoid methyltransferase-like protein